MINESARRGVFLLRTGAGITGFGLLAAVALSAIRPTPAASAPTPPNFLVILTDDQPAGTLKYMPFTKNLVVDQGIEFKDAFVPTSVCCPSRASILTGNYAHTHGVWTNDPPNGAFQKFDDTTTIATILDDAGYDTAMAGKYMNRYRAAAESGYVPPGWDRWYSFAEDNGAYWNWTEIADDGTGPVLIEHGDMASDYSTSVLTRRSMDFIEEADDPFFLLYAPYAMHGSYKPHPNDQGDFAGLNVNHRPNFNEVDMRDKPQWARSLKKLTARDVERNDNQYRRGVETLQAVDRAVLRFVTLLESQGELDDTMIVFLSDNGKSFGEHRWSWKDVAWDESTQIPMAIRFDRTVPAPGVSNELVLNVDLAETIAEAAGLTPPPTDGESLMPLLDGPPFGPRRQEILLEHLEDGSDKHYNPTYCGVRTREFLYVAYSPYEEELYDLDDDPWLLESQDDNPLYFTERNQLRGRAHVLCNPLPPDPTFSLPPVV